MSIQDRYEALEESTTLVRKYGGTAVADRILDAAIALAEQTLTDAEHVVNARLPDVRGRLEALRRKEGS